MRGTSTSAPETVRALARDVKLSGATLTVSLSDGRTLSVPLAWYPRLLHASARERGRWRLIGRGEGLCWPELEEDLSVAGLVLGRPSCESPESLGRWLAQRRRDRPAARARARGPSRRNREAPRVQPSQPKRLLRRSRPRRGVAERKG